MINPSQIIRQRFKSPQPHSPDVTDLSKAISESKLERQHKLMEMSRSHSPKESSQGTPQRRDSIKNSNYFQSITTYLKKSD